MIDLDYYAWRERSTIDGTDRLLIPWSNPALYEYDFGFVFATAQEAIDFKAEDEAAADEDWVLVHYTGEIVDR